MNWSALTVAIALPVTLSAQYGGPPRLWWDAGQSDNLSWSEDYEDAYGQLSVSNQRGPVHATGHAFFEALGTNGRACVTCHQPANAMSVSAATLRRRWVESKGADPVFAAIDGSNCPGLPQADRASHSLLLDRGLFRISLPWPPKNVRPDFRIDVVRDPVGCNTDAVYGLQSAQPAISVYRRPRIAANLKYLTEETQGEARRVALMTDGREPSLRSQAISAVLGHEQANSPPSAEQLRQIVEFERQIFTAQATDSYGGLLTETGGPALLGTENLMQGKAVFLATAFTPWKDTRDERLGDLQRDFRLSAARGADVFFKRGFRMGASANATCATCHTEGAARQWMDIGTTNRSSEDALPDLPLFRITCANGRTVLSQDPGRALISGRCADVGAIVMQQFRGLAARAPYFSNGSANSIPEIVDFYDRRFAIGYTRREKEDLANFLRVL